MNKPICPYCKTVLQTWITRKQLCPVCFGAVYNRNGKMVTFNQAIEIDWLYKLRMHPNYTKQRFDNFRQILRKTTDNKINSLAIVKIILDMLTVEKCMDHFELSEIFRLKADLLSDMDQSPLRMLLISEYSRKVSSPKVVNDDTFDLMETINEDEFPDLQELENINHRIETYYYGFKETKYWGNDLLVHLNESQLRYVMRSINNNQFYDSFHLLNHSYPSKKVVGVMKKLVSKKMKIDRMEGDWRELIIDFDKYVDYIHNSNYMNPNIEVEQLLEFDCNEMRLIKSIKEKSRKNGDPNSNYMGYRIDIIRLYEEFIHDIEDKLAGLLKLSDKFIALSSNYNFVYNLTENQSNKQNCFKVIKDLDYIKKEIINIEVPEFFFNFKSDVYNSISHYIFGLNHLMLNEFNDAQIHIDQGFDYLLNYQTQQEKIKQYIEDLRSEKIKASDLYENPDIYQLFTFPYLLISLIT